MNMSQKYYIIFKKVLFPFAGILVMHIDDVVININGKDGH